ncbi:hypothetical protein B2J73_18105 [Stutzerimonas stutzeri]|jgi:hypothetical protein|uniref:hypothetical protein n=1 Tax=Stutzerimonas TaxID=2901164 RepID=UPI0009A28999|nr:MULTISPECIES: hypothetical protein [Stutzerimonas]MDH0214525.1 hypothetical protein [Stutzerimonas stutzeri]MDH0261860.1 hypothetical protein [Stutzerimonas stutzeri]MDI9730473.1 hypothetical protein [Stutzerimonas stutzeri]MDI9750250.1 hypothetical protein [Stutzerimonas stutzeri]OPG82067.1 hypothetical protein B2J73_18105 [Stutzerimonas stutzeri]
MDVTYGLNAYRTTGQLLKLDILQSKAGWYIGTIDHDGPVSRESGYYKTPQAAYDAMRAGNWEQHLD